ncbi:peptide ABC transporter permease [Actinomycetes bacterium]|jgi:peptide/nickel transport system permease protein|nr:peptide ABC transporter permease [Actinomycetes bacterium]
MKSTAPLQRLVQLLLVVVGSTFFVSILIRLLPVGLEDIYVVNPDPVGRAKEISDLGLDLNPFAFYFRWLSGFFRGDFGSYVYPGPTLEPVSEHITRTLPVTLQLIVYVQIVALAFAIPLGLVSAYKVGTRVDRVISNGLFIFSSVPSFVIALLLAFYIGVQLGWVPPLGYAPPFCSAEDIDSATACGFGEHFKLMVLPVVSLSIPLIASYTRLLRTDVIATLREDFVTMAASKGLSNRRILWTHVFRPSSITLFTSAALNMGALVGGALVIETIFSIPGIGFEIALAIGSRQYFALQAYIAIIAFGYVFFNVLVDLTVGLIDPRAKERRK